MKQTLPFIFLAVLQAASLVQAQGAPPTPPPAPAPAAPAMEGKLDSIIGKIEYNERLDTKLDGIITRLDSGDRVSNKLDTILSAIKEHDQKLEKLATTPATPAAAVAPAAATVATPAATVAPAAPAPPSSGDVSLIQLNVNDVWIVLTAAMVFFMQAGFVMLEIGACRAKNTINIVMKSFLDFCICAIVFLLVGFAFMFGTSWNGVIGTDSF